MHEKISKYLMWVFYAFFIIVFGILIINLIYNNTEYRYDNFKLIPRIVLCLTFLCFAYYQLSKYDRFLNKHHKKILFSFLAVMGIIQIYYGYILRFEPAYDLEAIYGGAIELVKSGAFPNHLEYFYRHTNNIGPTFILYIVFQIATWLGGKDYFAVAMLFNCALSLSTMATVFFICKKVLSARHAVFSLILFAVSLPFYFIAPVFYTDALSMLFPVLFYYLYLRLKDAETRKGRIILGCLTGLAGVIGLLMKFTVLIALIAVAIDMFLNKPVKKIILPAACSALIIILLLSCFNVYIYSVHLDKEQVDYLATPYLHKVMMGLKGNGRYNPDDYNFTWSFPDAASRDRGITEKIEKRIKDYGVSGMLKLFTLKGITNFGDGTYELSAYLDDNPKAKSPIHESVLYAGSKYDAYRHMCTAAFYSILILMLFSAVGSIYKKSADTFKVFVPRLAVFGIYLFLLTWETSGRYSMNYIPMIFISAVLGIDCFFFVIKSIGRATLRITTLNHTQRSPVKTRKKRGKRR